jgi:hypothetical protein
MQALRMLLRSKHGLSANCCTNMSAGLGRSHVRGSTVDVLNRIHHRHCAYYRKDQHTVAAAGAPRSKAGAAAVKNSKAAAADAAGAATARGGTTKKMLLIDGHNLAARVSCAFRNAHVKAQPHI